jgi:hypothetical protein
MLEREFRLSSDWFDCEQYLMKRLEQIVSGHGDGPFKKDSGYKWQLDSSNNWWANIRKYPLGVTVEGKEPTQFKYVLVIAARYEWQPLEEVVALAKKLFGVKP